MRSITRTLPLLLFAFFMASTQASAAPSEEEADYFQEYFPSSDGINTLHADILRPEGLSIDGPSPVRTPVIVTVSPYTNHGGVPTIDDPETHVAGEGPSERFDDFLNLSGALRQGYTYVYVDLPGFGGSSGCNDWGGNREQIAVKDAVEWAASQPWSNGRVGLIGKSYDAWTGLMGISQQPEGLEAVVALEPVFSGYNYLYNNGVRFTNSVVTPALFQAFDAQPGPPLSSDPQYLVNGAPQAWCYGVNEGMQAGLDDPNEPFWLERNLLRSGRGEETPLLLTQGFLEANTKPDAAFDYWNGLAGTENQAWFSQFDHCRGWETNSACGGSGAANEPGEGDELSIGRAGFIDEVMRFFDEHLKGIEPSVEDPTITVQDNLGRYRAETDWPPADSQERWTDLNTGSYRDDNGNRYFGTAAQTGNGIWSISQVLPHDVWLAGEPVLKARVDVPAPRANLVGLVYDIDPEGNARLINRGAYLLRGNGEQVATFDLYGQDWLLRSGHRLGVLVTGSDSSWWNALIPTQQTVTVKSASIGLPFLTYQRTEFLDGFATAKLEQHLGRTAPVSPAEITAAEQQFNVPGPLVPPPTETETKKNGKPRKPK
ncbi:MAG: CocE/NonD family hydrolase [Actinomycetota bacterium]|nr:CocE/NonD family hydrolase [Actinomycetota bacterium]